ncbi:unnamed protein product [Lactuca virosa]|uniref:Uncharacterized protein n=1 Tax=Lactuca virosa TaxID=75947 RepID=A0AAU9PSV7_9ASTR|nr:unnamed protein product [Lactuca virosa]
MQSLWSVDQAWNQSEIRGKLKSATNHQLHVSYGEWFTFAFENQFYGIARKETQESSLPALVVMAEMLTGFKTLIKGYS